MANSATDGSRVAELGRLAREWSTRKVDELTLDRAGLSPGYRRMITAGYLTTVCLLGAVLAAAVVPGPQVEFVGDDGPHRVAISVVVLFSATFVIGWALILTGASDAGSEVFAPIGYVCGYEVFVLYASGVGQVIVAVVGIGLISLVVATESSDRWKAHPLAELSIWLAVLAAATGLGFLMAEGPSSPIGREYVAARFTLALSVPIWIWLGYDAVRAGIDLGRVGASVASRWAGGAAYSRVVAAATIASPLIVAALGTALGWISEALNGWFAFCLFASLPLAVACARDVARHRWSVEKASLFIALSISLAAVSLSGALATYGVGLVEAIASALPFPALFLFAVLAAYDVIVVGVREAERDGQPVPRSGRVLMYFGAVLLIVGSLALMYSATNVDARESPARALPAAFFFGWLVFGVPKYVQTVRNRRGRLVPPSKEPVT